MKTHNEIVELSIESIGFEGVAVGRSDGIVCFVRGAVPGDVVRARVFQRKRSYMKAEVESVVSASHHRTDPPCPHFLICGGCSWQQLKYDMQLEWKRQHVVDSMVRIGGIESPNVAGIVGSDKQYAYRNKMEFSFGASRWFTRQELDIGAELDMSFALGLHVPGRFDKVRDISYCHLQHENANMLLNHTHVVSAKHRVSAYHQRRHCGFARHLVIRTSAFRGTMMGILITTTPSSEQEMAMIEDWFGVYQKLSPESTLIHAINDSKSPVAVGSIQRAEGPGYIEDTVADVRFRISPFSFFQTNVTQADKLARLVAKLTVQGNAKTVWDFYCGTGTLSLPIAIHVQSVFGFELVESSVLDARHNAGINGISNAQFAVCDLHAKAAIENLREYPSPDVVVVDPPRSGLHARICRLLLDLLAERIIYVSCNPATQARDLGILQSHYKVMEIVPVDMFPQTWHIESIAVLHRITTNGKTV